MESQKDLSTDKKGFFIKNILVIGQENGLNGEYRQGKYIDIYTNTGKCPYIFDDNIPDPQRVDRIVNQIKKLGAYAKQHQNIKRLTRLITDEFSFYTRGKPLTLNEYRSIIDKTSEALKDLPPNIVLVISSMPVEWSDGTLRNAVLHIQSPHDNNSHPIIHHISKEKASKMDPIYVRANNIYDCYQYAPDDYSSPKHSPDVVLKGTCAQCYSQNQHKSAVVVRGVNLPPIIETIDICFDHANQIAMRNVKPLLQGMDKDIPFHISHIITSNYISLNPLALTASPIHADWRDKRSGDVTQKKNEKQAAEFGGTSSFYVFHQMRAEVLNMEEFEISSYKMSDILDIRVSEIMDSHKNTLLHQVFLPNKTTISSPDQYRQIGTFRRIINHFWDEAINQQNNDGDTPLHLALKITNDETILLRLLEQGARLDIKNKAGKTPLQLAYENNNFHIINLFLYNLMNNIHVYLAHKDSILTLLAEIPDVEMKRKIAASALCFEISSLVHEKIDEEQAIQLLIMTETSPVGLFIQHNINQLLATFKKGILYSYLVDSNAILENKEQIATLPAAIQAHLLSEDLLILKQSFFYKNNNFLFNKGLMQLFQGLTDVDSDFVVNLIKEIDSDSDLDELREIIIPSIILKLLVNKKMVDKILLQLPDVEETKIKDKIIHDCLEQYVYVEIIKNELKEFSPQLSVMAMAWSKLADINFFPDDSGLTISEKILLESYKNDNAALLDYLVSQSPQIINFRSIDKITNELEDEKKLGQEWFYRNLLENELKKSSNIDFNILFFVLSYYPFVDFDKEIYPGITVADEILYKAYNKNMPSLLNRILDILPPFQSKEAVDILIDRISTFSSNAQDKIKSWLYNSLLQRELARKNFANMNVLLSAFESDYCQVMPEIIIELACNKFNSNLLEIAKRKYPQFFNPFVLLHAIDKITTFYNPNTKKWLYEELLKNELKHGPAADLHLILAAMPFCDLNAPSGIGLFTIGQQLIVQAYQGKCPFILNDLKRMSHPGLRDVTFIEKITSTLTDSKLAQQWIYQELMKNEFKRGSYADVWTIVMAMPFCDLNASSDIGYFTIGEQLISHAYQMNDPRLLDEIQIKHPQLLSLATINKVAMTFPYKEIVQQWLYQELIKNELVQSTNWETIFFALTSSPFSLLNVPSRMAATIGEQLLIAIYHSQDPALFTRLLKTPLPPSNLPLTMEEFEKIINKLNVSNANFVPEGVAWLQKQFAILSHSPSPVVVPNTSASSLPLTTQSMNLFSVKEPYESVAENKIAKDSSKVSKIKTEQIVSQTFTKNK